MIIKDGLEALEKSDFLPEAAYELLIKEVREPARPEDVSADDWVPDYSVAELEVLKPGDPAIDIRQVAGRTISYWLYSKYPKVGRPADGLIAVMRALNIRSLPNNDTHALQGMKFVGKIKNFHVKSKNEWRQQVEPIGPVVGPQAAATA